MTCVQLLGAFRGAWVGIPRPWPWGRICCCSWSRALLLLSELMESCCLLQLPQQLLPRLQGGTGEDKRPKKSR